MERQPNRHIGENLSPQYDRSFRDIDGWLYARRFNWVISDENKAQYAGSPQKAAVGRYIQLVSEVVEPQFSGTLEFDDSSRQRGLCTMFGLKLGFLIARKAEGGTEFDGEQAILDLRLAISAEDADNVGERGRVTRDFLDYGQAGIGLLSADALTKISQWQDRYVSVYDSDAQDFFALSIGAAIASSKKAHDDRLFLKMIGYDWDQGFEDLKRAS